jgi:hypothetical protein
MTLHPIAVVDQVIEEYRSYLHTEFRARDEKLRRDLEEALDQPRFLAQETFFQAHRPFSPGKRWKDLPIDAKLATVMEERARRHGSPEPELSFLHQSDAIEELLAPDPRAVVVTTGTGSGKTECFLLPVIQNAIEDATRFRKGGLTAILVYPMNALANDQEARIKEYLEASGHTHVKVARYDRSTSVTDRIALRKSPPHILLTNYMMLEYLLVRPADRDDLFANHRCRFVVLDEVHTYRGSLGANIALLFRRLRAHLEVARQDWGADNREDARRFPRLVPVATSATIKSVDETGRTPEEVRRLRDQAVQEFLAKLTGDETARFRVIGETLRKLEMPAGARWSPAPVEVAPPAPGDLEGARRALSRLAGLPADTPLEQAAASSGILWSLADLLIRRPVSVPDIVETILAQVPERRGVDPAAVRGEVETALSAGAALPDGTPGALRLRTHRFVRGGWRFHRCVDPACGKLSAGGETQCGACGKPLAPLLICRSCGADALGFKGPEDPESAALVGDGSQPADGDWVLYDAARHVLTTDEVDDDGAVELRRKQMKGREVRYGSFDPATCSFSLDAHLYPLTVALAPARNTCLVCGSTAGAGSLLTPVSLGTSAAVRVVGEGLVEGLARQNRDKPGYDGKERLLIFADSRQDAAHQARFINYAGRYDRMRRRLLGALADGGGKLSLDAAVQALMVAGIQRRDNPHVTRLRDPEFVPPTTQVRAKAWEEAPLLDDLAASAGYRATVLNLGLVGVRYGELASYVRARGGALASSLGITSGNLLHLCRCLLDEMRVRKAFSRPMLCYHPLNPACPDEFKAAADWERRIKSPNGYAWGATSGEPLAYLDTSEVADGVTLNNAWRKPKAGGRGPSLERKLKHLLKRMGGIDPSEHDLVGLLSFLTPVFLKPSRLHGFYKATDLLQVNADNIVLETVAETDRFRCSVCNVKLPWAGDGAPCPACHGVMTPWRREEVERNRYVQRMLKGDLLALHAGEHTAQVTGNDRIALEEDFKGPASRSSINVLSCSPTLEMGIDVGGLDAVVMRNVPPRPDNYAQRGGRAGRRSRVGVILGYARNTPHDGYFYDRPQEMIAGEVPAPPIHLGNRDVVLRHLNAIALGAAVPGVAGRMGEYVTVKGEAQTEAIEALVVGFEAAFGHAVDLAMRAWGRDILGPAGLDDREKLLASLREQPPRMRELFDRIRLQVIQLQGSIDRWRDLGMGDRAAVHAMDLIRRLLGIRSDSPTAPDADADDRTAAYPLRRFAEFGLLPGYEFPSEPATLRLMGDGNEEEPLSVDRRFGLSQYQPEAIVHARGHRWRVVGLDRASPWNPKTEGPSWIYTICARCDLRFGGQEVQCPRCKAPAGTAASIPGYEFGGFLAVRYDNVVLEEEERLSRTGLVRCHPQWNRPVRARFKLASGWQIQLRNDEEVRWLNEARQPTESELKRGALVLHDGARGFPVCPSCGVILTAPEEEGSGQKGRKKPRRKGDADPYGHTADCTRRGQPPEPLAITTRTRASTLRIVVDLPWDLKEEEYKQWGYSLGFALRTGMRQLYMLDGPEVEFELESAWEVSDEGGKRKVGSLTFIDPALGGSGILDRAATELHLVAGRAVAHLDHANCDSACYRCLKSYQNQRIHQFLNWPRVIPDLEELGATAPEAVPLEVGDPFDPRPWLEAFDAGVGSPLELKFLRLFEEHGLAVEKQVPLAADEGGPSISTADFVVKGTRVAIYIDGAAFHTGHALRRDRFIRRRLREGSAGWKVVELRARDLTDGPGVIAGLRGGQ